MTRLVSALLASSLLALAACSGPQGRPLYEIADEINATRYAGLDRISPGDKLEVRFFEQQDWNQIVTVQRDGRASFLGVGDLIVAGRLPAELDELLTEEYGGVLTGSPDLSVVVNEQAPRMFHVMGEVKKPGSFELGEDDTTFLAGLASTGGHARYTSWLGNTVLVRYDPETKTQESWVIDAREEHWTHSKTILLQEHDVILVPNTRIDRVGIQLTMWIARMIPFPSFGTAGV